jgi:hypothetical protein
MSRNHGYRKRGDKQELQLRVRMLNSEHPMDIAQKAQDELGDRWSKIGPLDFTWNLLVEYVNALATAMAITPGISGAQAGMLASIGDSSSKPLIRKYKTAGYRPMPTDMTTASRDVERYVVACWYCGLYVGWSERLSAPFLEPITPDLLEIVYDPGDPRTIIGYKHCTRRKVGNNLQDVVDFYDLHDLENPAFRVMLGTQDVTKRALGATFEGTGYPAEWRWEDGTPFAPISVYGRPENLARLLEIVEATLRVAVGWSWWWAGVRDACDKRKCTKNMRLDTDSEASADGDGDGDTGIAIGPEDVENWVDTNPNVPGEHWQWDASFQAQEIGDSISRYADRALVQLGFPADAAQSGGEPLKVLIEERNLEAHKHYDAMRAGDVHTLQLVAAISNRKTAGTPKPTSYSEKRETYGISYNDEMRDELAHAAGEEDTNGRGNGSDGDGTGDGEAGQLGDGAGEE